MSCGAPIVSDTGVELGHVEIMRTIEKVGAEAYACPVEFTSGTWDETWRKQAWKRKCGCEPNLIGIEY